MSDLTLETRPCRKNIYDRPPYALAAPASRSLSKRSSFASRSLSPRSRMPRPDLPFLPILFSKTFLSHSSLTTFTPFILLTPRLLFLPLFLRTFPPNLFLTRFLVWAHVVRVSYHSKDVELAYIGQQRHLLFLIFLLLLHTVWWGPIGKKGAQVARNRVWLTARSRDGFPVYCLVQWFSSIPPWLTKQLGNL